MDFFKKLFLISILLIFQSIFCTQTNIKPKLITPFQQENLNKELARSIISINNNNELLKKVDELIIKGASPTEAAYIESRTVTSPIGWALYKKRSDKVIEALLVAGADPDLAQNASPVWHATNMGRLSTVKLLKKHDAKLDTFYYGINVLMLAAQEGKFDIVDYLINENDIDKNIKDFKGATYKEHALYGAIENNDLKRMKEFLDLGADPNQAIHYWLSGSKFPLVAAFAKNNEIITLLMNYGANPYVSFVSYGCKSRVIDFVKNDEQKQLVEKLYKERQEQIKSELDPYFSAKTIQDIIASY